jgi:hypothetical protein
MSDLPRILFFVAIAVSLPAVVVTLGAAFHSIRSRAFLLRHGRSLVATGCLAWGACLVAQLGDGASGWGLVGSLVGLGLTLGVALARGAAAPPDAAVQARPARPTDA